MIVLSIQNGIAKPNGTFYYTNRLDGAVFRMPVWVYAMTKKDLIVATVCLLFEKLHELQIFLNGGGILVEQIYNGIARISCQQQAMVLQEEGDRAVCVSFSLTYFDGFSAKVKVVTGLQMDKVGWIRDRQEFLLTQRFGNGLEPSHEIHGPAVLISFLYILMGNTDFYVIVIHVYISGKRTCAIA